MHDICMTRDARICACVYLRACAALPPSGGLDALTVTFLFVVCAILAIVGCTRFGPADPEVDELVSEPRRGWLGRARELD